MEKYCAALSSFQIFKMSQGDAKWKVFVKCTVLRVGRIAPLARERSHVLFGTHINISDTGNGERNSISLDYFSRLGSRCCREKGRKEGFVSALFAVQSTYTLGWRRNEDIVLRAK